MRDRRYTLVADGPRDRVLLQVVDWLLRQAGELEFRAQYFDPRTLRRPPQTLAERIAVAIDLQPCDLLVVHRDAETASRPERCREVAAALALVPGAPAALALVPVRMTEAWFLFAERALREAAGNPGGRQDLGLPATSRIEGLDAKTLLETALRAASGLAGRRLKGFDTSSAFYRLAECIDDFSPLRALGAFQGFEAELRSALGQLR